MTFKTNVFLIMEMDETAIISQTNFTLIDGLSCSFIILSSDLTVDCPVMWNVYQSAGFCLCDIQTTRVFTAQWKGETFIIFSFAGRGACPWCCAAQTESRCVKSCSVYWWLLVSEMQNPINLVKQSCCCRLSVLTCQLNVNFQSLFIPINI